MLYNFGLDWLTLTNIIEKQEGMSPLMKVFQEMAGPIKGWKAGGYEGKQDPDSGLKYGSRIRQDGRAEEILVAPGELASQVEDDNVNPLEHRITRMDLQVTVRLDKPNVNLASDLYDRLVRAKEIGQDAVKRREVKLVKSSTGQTLYLGSRKTGRKFFRLYDKSVDVGEEVGMVWRQEVQYGRDLAFDAMEIYQNIRESSASVISLVCAEFRDAMSYSLIDHMCYRTEVVAGSPKPAIKLGKKLEWLRTCVRPTIALMIDNDLEQEMLRALGLRENRPARTGKPSNKFIRHVLRANKILTDDDF